MQLAGFGGEVFRGLVKLAACHAGFALLVFCGDGSAQNRLRGADRVLIGVDKASRVPTRFALGTRLAENGPQAGMDRPPGRSKKES
jgi:hypothetical protein